MYKHSQEDLYMTTATLKNWGNSLGLRVPKNVLEEANLKENSEVTLEVIDGAIIVKPKEGLKELLAKITPDNMHNDEEWLSEDKPQGNEVW